MDNFDLRKYLAENKLVKEDNDEFLDVYFKGKKEDEFVDLDAIEKTLRDNYESFESKMNHEEFEKYLDEYLDNISSYGEKEAYDNLSLPDLLQDFVDYVSYSE